MTEERVTFGSGLEGILDGTGTRGPVIVTHGSGRGMDSPILEKTAVRLAEMGFRVLRFNFAYLGKRPAPSAGGKNELPELLSAIDLMKEHGEPVLIGKSFGARVCANAAADGSKVRGLVFYGMPLQGMSKTSKPRDWSHLARIKAPKLFITGHRDTLCPLDQLNEVLSTLKGPTRSEIVAGDHSFKPKSEDAAIDLCCAWINDLS
jgi:predicted alpha/beta-hydrolase family hydrolase